MNLLQELTVELGLPTPELQRIITTAPKRYKTYQIPKRGGGWREIAHPSAELKVLQRFLLEKFLSRFPVHSAAMAYVRGRNISNNAHHHATNAVFLKMDFVSFFPSIKVADWKAFLARHPAHQLSQAELEATTRILFWGSGSSRPTCLSIGAPTSPMMSNILLFDLDTALANAAVEHGVRYTRYADDITLSGPTPERVLAFEGVVRREVSRLKSPRLKFNERKRGLYHKGQRRLVTGLIVTPDSQVSIGRERKRLISSLLHRSSLNQLDVERRALLKGLLGFAIANEPAFLARMRKKYTNDVVDQALSYHIPSRAERGKLR